ncbi:hypothetical protein NM208_g4802 [Fusarium decemcellulare]|uniref:Uncharacterized protein n=2 Tax=Fusarium decemcellulare TaxID=57161 RepID=A0ACC1SJD3_9HYPO|nr:hypothetical protein NM208_g7476 [Fusarium decemcellulare]KAJ3541020.1 hypothetical protein NM208_g4802 [Fusarium decemcellulare]
MPNKATATAPSEAVSRDGATFIDDESLLTSVSPHPIPRPTRPSPSASASTAPLGPSSDDIPDWLDQQVINWTLPPLKRRSIARMWMTEAFDSFNAGRFGLPPHLRRIEANLEREWIKRNREVKEAAKTKRGGVEQNHAPEPALPPLGNPKGKYTVESPGISTESTMRRTACELILSPGDGTTMRGIFRLGEYEALIYFEKRSQKSSTKQVRFKWRGREYPNHRYRGDSNKGWMKFLGDGRIEGWFDKFSFQFEGQKGSGVGKRRAHNPEWFWEEWRDYNGEDPVLGNMSLSDFNDWI